VVEPKSYFYILTRVTLKSRSNLRSLCHLRCKFGGRRSATCRDSTHRIFYDEL